MVGGRGMGVGTGRGVAAAPGRHGRRSCIIPAAAPCPSTVIPAAAPWPPHLGRHEDGCEHDPARVELHGRVAQKEALVVLDGGGLEGEGGRG